MTNYIGPYPTPTGEPLDVDADYVGAFTEIPNPGGSPLTGVWPLGVYTNPFVVDVTPAVFLAALIGVGKTAALFTQQDGTPLAIMFGLGPPAGTVVQESAATSVNGLPCVSVYTLDLDPWIVEGTIASVTAALTPAPVPPGGSRVIMEATFDPLGTILSQQSDLGLTLAPTVPHVPGDPYFWSLTGAVPLSYIVLTSSPAGRKTVVSRQVAPFSPDFLIATYQPSRSWSAARVNGATGVASPSLALSTVRLGNGKYACTITTLFAPVNFVVTVSLGSDDMTAKVTYVGPTTFNVDVRDLLGIATDCDFSALVTGLDDGTGNDGFEAVDGFMQFVIVQA